MAGPRHARVREGEARLNLEAVCILQAKGYGLTDENCEECCESCCHSLRYQLLEHREGLNIIFVSPCPGAVTGGSQDLRSEHADNEY